jgi:hypothetical protein
MFWVTRTAVNLLGLGLLLGGVLLVAAPGRAGVLDASWTAPTTNTDSSPLRDLALYRLYYGSSNPPCPGSSFLEVASSTPSPLSNETVAVRLTGLTRGTLYYFSVTAVDTSNQESGCSTPAPSAVAQMEFTASPTGTVNFGSVNLGSILDQTFTVQSNRSGTVLGTVSTSAPYSIVAGSPFTLTGVGATRTVTVRFRPTTSATATVNVNFTADGDSFSRIVTGAGKATDTTLPTVAMTSPTSNPTYSTSSSTLTLGGTASDNVGVTQVTWANSRGGSGTAAATTSWTAGGIILQPGTNVLTVTARDAAGNIATASLTVTLSDTTLPTISITAPATGATVGGRTTVMAMASDNVGVAGVQFTLSGANLGAEDTTNSYAVTWDTTTVANGTYTLTAVARDATGNLSTPAAVSVIVANDQTPPVLSAIRAGAITGAGTTISWTTDEASNSQVEYGATPAYGSASAVNGSLVTAHGMPLGGLAANTLYHFRVRSRDAAGNLAISGDFAFTTLAADLTAPAVVLSAPSPGSAVADRVAVAATATDNVGVAGVQFQLDGAALGAEVRTAPYALEWDTTTVADGPHTLRAVARDAAGNATTSASVSVTVANGIVRVLPQDTFINVDATNYSTSARLHTFTWPDNKVANAILMKFDLAGLPAGAVVQEATLHLALVESDGQPEGTYTVTAHKVVGKDAVIAGATGYTADGVTGWTPTACCYGHRPMAQADISAAYATQAIDKTLGYKAWTITALVQDWLAAPATNFGLLLNSDPSKPQGRYRLFASMEHPDSALRPFLRITYARPSTLDGTPPMVAVTAPAAGASVPDRVRVEAGATDNVGVAGVQFQLDGAALGAEVRTAPYALEWDTTTVADGPHTLRAVARDAAGNVATSATVSITVVNGSVRVSLAPQDTFINADATNYSTSARLATFTWPDNKVANAILMKFDLAGLPAGAVVQEATLHLALVESDGQPEGTYTVTAHKVVGKDAVIAGATGYTADGVTDWTPNACCHSNRPMAQADISAAYATQAIDKTLGYKAWTITALVQDWLAAPATNFGLLLNSDPSKPQGRYRYFASMEHPDSVLRPFLHITYSLPTSP